RSCSEQTCSWPRGNPKILPRRGQKRKGLAPGELPPFGSPWRGWSRRGDPGLLGHRGRFARATSPARPPEAAGWSALADADLASRRRRHRNARAAPPSLTDSTLGQNGFLPPPGGSRRRPPPGREMAGCSTFYIERLWLRVAILGACARGWRFASYGLPGWFWASRQRSCPSTPRWPRRTSSRQTSTATSIQSPLHTSERQWVARKPITRTRCSGF